MYAVSEQFKKAIQDNTRNYYWTGKITTNDEKEYPFANKDIVKGSGYISNQCCGSNEIEIGSVYSAELGITLYSEIDRYTLEGGIVTLSFWLDIGADTYEEVPMGIFEISEANRTINCLEIKAYDYMLRFEANFTNKVSSGFAFDLLMLACQECDVEFAHTQEEIETMPNGTTLLGIYSENDIETWRDLIFYVAQVLGCFATINRVGKLELRKYRNQSIMDISNKQRFSSSFSDFVTKYTAINSTNKMTETAEYYALDPDDGLTMNLGVNPLLQFGLKETRQKLCTNILNDIAPINYVPFDSTTIGNPAMDLGDIITFSGGHADGNQITCVTSIQYKVNGKHTIKCVGKNPRMAEAKSKNDKNISGLINQIEAGKIAVHTYMNASAFTLSSVNAEIVSIEFASNENTDAQFHASILMEVKADQIEKSGTATGTITIPAMNTESKPTTADETFDLQWKDDGKAVLTVTYIINDHELTTYYPIETFSSGKHIINLYYPLNGLESNAYNTFKVWMKITDGSATIGRGQCVATISGQGLSANNTWDGRLEFEDKTSIIPFNHFASIVGYETKVQTSQQTPIPRGIADVVVPITFGGITVTSLTETVKANPVVTRETIDTSDKGRMQYDNRYVLAADQFVLNLSYKSESHEIEFDRGKVTKMIMDTDQFARVDTMEVKNNGRL